MLINKICKPGLNHSSQVFNFFFNGPLKEYLLKTFEQNVPTGREVTKAEFLLQHNETDFKKNAFLGAL